MQKANSKDDMMKFLYMNKIKPDLFGGDKFILNGRHAGFAYVYASKNWVNNLIAIAMEQTYCLVLRLNSFISVENGGWSETG